jgi:UDPglucose--hexose-1-phosphate uridylyltransferase
MTPTELRHNPLTGRWVVQAPGRGRRPDDFDRASERAMPRPEHDPACPFCPGQENMLPAILDERSIGESPGWLVRAVPNKYPAFSGETAFQPSPSGPYRSAPASGRHEVIIVTPRHDQDLADLDQSHLELVLSTYVDRYQRLLAEGVIEWALLFHNQGEAAGTSLEHSHSQLVGLPWVPAGIRSRAERAKEYQARSGRCLVCDIVQYELAQGDRTIDSAGDFVPFVPFCASAPFETWLVPRRHRPTFGRMGEPELSGLADCLGRTLRSLRAATGSAPFNLLLVSGPPASVNEDADHWLIRIVPRTTTIAGLEMGSDVLVNTSSPERDAEQLRLAWSALT